MRHDCRARFRRRRYGKLGTHYLSLSLYLVWWGEIFCVNQRIRLDFFRSRNLNCISRFKSKMSSQWMWFWSFFHFSKIFKTNLKFGTKNEEWFLKTKKFEGLKESRQCFWSPKTILHFRALNFRQINGQKSKSLR